MKQKKVFLMVLVLFLIIFNFSIVLAKPRAPHSPPSSPTGFTVTSVNPSEINLTWNTVSGASGYKLFRSSTYDSNYTQIAALTSTTYKNTGLNASTKYWYFVRSYNSYGTSADSIHTSATTNQSMSSSSKIILGFATYYYSGDSSSYNSLINNSTTINEIATDTFTTDGLGNISGIIPSSQISYANNNGIKPYAMITNKFDGSIAKTLLESSVNRKNLINNISNNLKSNSYKGVNVDLEGLYYYDRNYFTTFMNELYTSLHSQGFVVTVSVPAKTSDGATNSWNGAFDYAQIGNYSDKVILMAYDEHYPGGPAGPIASIGWVQNVVNYASTIIPKNKILLGTAAYGYDWSSNGTKAYSINQTYNLALTYGSQIMWDSISKNPYFNYTDPRGIKHTVWFENSTSLSYKLDIVNNSNILGISIWRLGLENNDYWTVIKTKLIK